MNKTIEELRQKRQLLICESIESKTQFVKNKIQKRLKTVNKELFKRTKNPIYL